ncbi:MAG TPA: phytanoyl-CoA dioxygenase family protein [Xanthobacteraceae bacterium]|nr:phytanoyl-CoA dioxygenase family protein [Xanthobacteraceae bacterium]
MSGVLMAFLSAESTSLRYASQPDITFFEREGYQVFRNVLPSHVTEMLRQLLYSQVDSMLDLLSKFGVPRDPKLAGHEIRALLSSPRADELDHPTRVLMTGHFPTQIRLSESFWEIAKTPSLRAILAAIFQTDRLFMHLPPMARYVLPGNLEAGVPPHQDISYNTHMSDFVTVWLPLVPIDSICGGVTIYEGLKEGTIPATKTVRNGVWIEGIQTEGLRPVDCAPMELGDVLIFNPYVIHGSMPNVSDRIRLSIDCRFFSGATHSNKHYLDMSEWAVKNPN